jgi:enoyl-[acyl-carrier protein] reductase I
LLKNKNYLCQTFFKKKYHSCFKIFEIKIIMANNLLAGKRGIIFGALDDKSIAWKVAERCVEEGAKITLTNVPVALRFGGIKELAQRLDAEIIPADATSMADLENLFSKSMEILGGKIDFVLHSIGMSINVRKKREYTDLNHEWMQKTLDISAISFHKMMQTAYKMDAMNDWGSIVGLTYMAAQRTFPSYNEMAEAKSLLESFARSFGYHFGKKNHVRVNTISQSPTMTTAGSGVKGFDDFFSYAEKCSPLGNASSEACADYCITMFSDLTKMVTMQNLFHDGGFSSMGMSPEVFDWAKEQMSNEE